MHMREQLILNFGPRSLSRIYCARCKEETLHVRGVCNHCKPRPNGSGEIRGRGAKAESWWRADHDALYKAPMSARHREP